MVVANSIATQVRPVNVTSNTIAMCKVPSRAGVILIATPARRANHNSIALLAHSAIDISIASIATDLTAAPSAVGTC
jgi:hypothetical protein